MTINTWKQEIDKGFTESDITRFNELYELKASSLQFERISISNDGLEFLDSTSAGPVEDIVLKPKGNTPDQDKSSLGTYAIFLGVSSYQDLILKLISSAKENNFDTAEMLDDIEDNQEMYDCEAILFPSNEGEISI